MSLPAIYYDNRLNDATPSASTTATGYDVNNLTDWRPYTEWQPTALPATITVDAGAAASVDYWLVWGHDLATQGATIQLRKSNDNFSADDNLVDSYTPTADDPFMRVVSTADERYWRFQITGSTMPTLGIAAMGAALEIPKYLKPGFDPRGRKPQGQFNRSVAGMPLGRTIQYEDWSQSLTFENLAWSWIRNTWEPAWEAHLRSLPFVFCWEPGSYSTELALVTIQDGFATPHNPGSYGNLSISLTGLLA